MFPQRLINLEKFSRLFLFRKYLSFNQYGFPHFAHFITVWSLRNFCITWKIFREINFTVKLFTKEVVLTEIFQKTRDTKISETPH